MVREDLNLPPINFGVSIYRMIFGIYAQIYAWIFMRAVFNGGMNFFYHFFIVLNPISFTIYVRVTLCWFLFSIVPYARFFFTITYGGGFDGIYAHFFFTIIYDGCHGEIFFRFL